MSDSPNLHTLVTSRPDAEVGAEHKKLIQDKLVELCELMDAAKKAGFHTNLQLGMDFAGRYTVQ